MKGIATAAAEGDTPAGFAPMRISATRLTAPGLCTARTAATEVTRSLTAGRNDVIRDALEIGIIETTVLATANTVSDDGISLVTTKTYDSLRT